MSWIIKIKLIEKNNMIRLTIYLKIWERRATFKKRPLDIIPFMIIASSIESSIFHQEKIWKIDKSEITICFWFNWLV